MCEIWDAFIIGYHWSDISTRGGWLWVWDHRFWIEDHGVIGLYGHPYGVDDYRETQIGD